MQKPVSIRYLSHGALETGGYRHELFFARQLAAYFTAHGNECTLELMREEKVFHGLGHLGLQYRAFKNARATYTITVVRLALAALLRNLFSSRHVIIILHHTDTSAMGPALKRYFNCLLFLLRYLPSGRFLIVTVSPFQQKVLEKRTGKPVFVFPNFMDTTSLLKYRTTEKHKRIHLGQYSDKNHPDIYVLAEALASQGYDLYFSSLKPVPALGKPYRVLCFDTYDTYMQHMAGSLYTLALTGMDEGWNRVVHESILAGTPVIGYRKGGLGIQLEEANMFIVENVEQALRIIQSGEMREAPDTFIEKYNEQQAANCMEECMKSFSAV